MKDRSGFTLIELLAVILILGVIVLIAMPVVNNLVQQAKKESAILTASNYIDAVEKMIMKNQLLDDINLSVGSHDISELTDLLDIRGKKPTKGILYIGNNNLVTNATLCINNYKVDYIDGTGKIYNNTNCNDMNSSVYGFDETKGVNKPVLAIGMTPVKWDSSNNEITTTTSDPNWYDYANKKWANAKSTDGSYWVWIPRYAYKMTNGYHSSLVGTIDIKFLKGTTNITDDTTKIENNGYEVGVKDTSNNYFVHPSFDFNGSILGYWVAKYEPTAVEGVLNGYMGDGTCPETGDNVSSKTVKIIPNATSWRCIDIKNSFDAVLNMKNNPVYGWNSNKVDTHMMKNTEWGAVAYLTQSQYGANTELWINNANNYETGCAANSVSQGGSTTGCLNTYNTLNGVKSSTTFNITGIYDMSGGAIERTLSNYNNSSATSGFTNAYITNLSDKYIDRYNTPVPNLLNGIGMDYDNTVYGDAVYETSGSIARYNGTTWVGNSGASWYNDSSYMPFTSATWFLRGGAFNNGTFAGLYTFSSTFGGLHNSYSFRPVLYVSL